MMARFRLNCPSCQKPLEYLPHEGLTLRCRCAEHGVVLLHPLVEVADADEEPARPVMMDLDESYRPAAP